MIRRNFLKKFLTGTFIATNFPIFVGAQVKGNRVVANAMSGKNIREPARDIPIFDEVDVVVCGGGPAGWAAAVASSRGGARTLLVEDLISLGGAATNGIKGRFGPFHDQEKFIVGGIPWEMLQKLVYRRDAYTPIPRRPTKNRIYYWLPYDPEALKFVCDQMIQESNANVVFGAKAVLPIMNGKSVGGVIFESKQGRFAVLSKILIDATGDGDIAVKAGAPFEIGRKHDGFIQPIGLTNIIHGIPESAKKYFTENRKDLCNIKNEYYNEQRDFVPNISNDNFLRPQTRRFNRDYVHNTNVTDDPRVFSDAVLKARKEAFNNLDFLRRHVPGCEDAFMSAQASILGVRESRRIVGDYVLTAEDVVSSHRFQDEIAQYHCYIDIHGDYKNPLHGQAPAPGTSYGIPYRCLLPKKVENLLVAGRCLSSTYEGLASVRMIPACMAMGEAAGTAAAMSTKKGCTPRTIDTQELRKSLKEKNVLL